PPFRIHHSALRTGIIPHSALRIPHSALESFLTPHWDHSALRVPHWNHSALRIPHSALEISHSTNSIISSFWCVFISPAGMEETSDTFCDTMSVLAISRRASGSIGLVTSVNLEAVS